MQVVPLSRVRHSIHRISAKRAFDFNVDAVQMLTIPIYSVTFSS